MTASPTVLRTDITVLKQLTAIRLDVAIWTARKKLTAADFGSSDLPPEKLASLGSKRVCNPEDLRIFAALKARAGARQPARLAHERLALFREALPGETLSSCRIRPRFFRLSWREMILARLPVPGVG